MANVKQFQWVSHAFTVYGEILTALNSGHIIEEAELNEAWPPAVRAGCGAVRRKRPRDGRAERGGADIQQAPRRDHAAEEHEHVTEVRRFYQREARGPHEEEPDGHAEPGADVAEARDPLREEARELDPGVEPARAVRPQLLPHGVAVLDRTGSPRSSPPRCTPTSTCHRLPEQRGFPENDASSMPPLSGDPRRQNGVADAARAQGRARSAREATAAIRRHPSARVRNRTMRSPRRARS